MRIRSIPFAALAVLMLAGPAVSQTHDGSIGYGGGAIMFTDFNAGGTGEAINLGTGWVANAHIEHFPSRGRVGGRINAAFSRRPLETPEDVRNIHAWIIGGDLLLRLASPTPGRTVAPFIAVGGGMVSYGLGRGSALSFEGAQYPGDTDRQWTVSGGLGFDILPDFSIFGTPSGLRLEVIDHVALKSPFEPFPSGDDFDPVHNIRASLSLIGLVEILR